MSLHASLVPRFCSEKSRRVRLWAWENTWLIFYLFIIIIFFGDKLPNCMPAKMKLQAVKLLGYSQDIYQLHVTWSTFLLCRNSVWWQQSQGYDHPSNERTGCSETAGSNTADCFFVPSWSLNLVSIYHAYNHFAIYDIACAMSFLFYVTVIIV